MSFIQAIASTIIFAVTSINTSADYTVDKGLIRVKNLQDIVITISKSPTDHVEEVCLALTMGQILRQSG